MYKAVTTRANFTFDPFLAVTFFAGCAVCFRKRAMRFHQVVTADTCDAFQVIDVL